jgi:hypothetical protein
MQAKPLGDAHFRVNANGLVADYHSTANMPGIRVAADVLGRHVTDLLPPDLGVKVLGSPIRHTSTN